MPKQKKSTGSQTPSLFEEEAIQPKELAIAHFIDDPRPPPLQMPDRGYLYSEAWRLECELRQLHLYAQTMSAFEWEGLWNSIAKARGQASCDRLKRTLVSKYPL